MTEINAATAAMTANESTENTDSAARLEMAERLSAKMHITLEDAKAALEAADWNALTATHLLEQEMFRRKQALNAVAEAEAPAEDAADDEPIATEAPAEDAAQAADKAKDAFKKLGHTAKNLIRQGNRRRFAIRKGDEQLLEMPVTALALLLLGSFGTCAFLMAAGLLAGCRYSIDEGGAAEA